MRNTQSSKILEAMETMIGLLENHIYPEDIRKAVLEAIYAEDDWQQMEEDNTIPEGFKHLDRLNK